MRCQAKFSLSSSDNAGTVCIFKKLRAQEKECSVRGTLQAQNCREFRGSEGCLILNIRNQSWAELERMKKFLIIKIYEGHIKWNRLQKKIIAAYEHL